MMTIMESVEVGGTLRLTNPTDYVHTEVNVRSTVCRIRVKLYYEGNGSYGLSITLDIFRERLLLAIVSG